MSFLNGSYLGGTEVLEEMPPEMIQQQGHALMHQQAQPAQHLAGDMIALPGGIVLPKQTLLIIAAAVAVTVLVWWKKQQRED